MSTPHIIFNVEYHQHYSEKNRKKIIESGNPKLQKYLKKSDFYRCNSKFDSVEYFSRDKATEKNDMETVKTLDKLMTQTDENRGSILGYAGDRPGSTGLWNRDGDLSEEQKKELREDLRKTESNIWSSVLSFTPEYAKDFCSSKAQAHNLVSKEIDKFFEAAGLDPLNMNWYASFHVNTENPHCHIMFWEKEKTKIKSNGQKSFSDGKLSKKSLNKFRELIAVHHRYRPEYWKGRDVLKKAMMHDFNKDIPCYNEIFKLHENFKLSPKRYQFQTAENKKRLHELKDALLETNPETKLLYDKYINQIKSEGLSIIKNLNENKIPIPPQARNFITNRTDEFNKRIFNALIKAIKSLDLEGPKIYTNFENKKNLRRESRESRKKNITKVRKFHVWFNDAMIRLLASMQDLQESFIEDFDSDSDDELQND
ncbi:MAG: relaxase MobL [Erysipelotrichales bacterium]|nr:relaxase MobL [Erysipelotrichales bacterium]